MKLIKLPQMTENSNAPSPIQIERADDAEFLNAIVHLCGKECIAQAYAMTRKNYPDYHTESEVE